MGRKVVTGFRSSARRRQHDFRVNKVQKRPSAAKRTDCGHSKCAWCGRLTWLCGCASDPAPSGHLVEPKLNEFLILASTDDRRRRFLTDCPDVAMSHEWIESFLLDDGSIACAIFGLLC